MFSDTHCHLPLVSEWNPTLHPKQLFSALCERKCAFVQDIGTKCDDLQTRISFVEQSISPLSQEQQNAVRNMMRFSAGIWPAPEAITARVEQVAVLEQNIATLLSTTGAAPKLSAVGECGLDHHWNPSGVDGRCESDFDQKMFNGEHELFLMQLDIAKRLKLPVIVHSRDAYEDTLLCIKEGGYDSGVIHCYAYGKKEAASFLDRGWYISLSGSVTYTKKSHMDEIESLVRYIPKEMLLLETDAPYLAPVPCRGQPNTPLLVEHTYRFVAEKLGMTVEELCKIVDRNAVALFK